MYMHIKWFRWYEQESDETHDGLGYSANYVLNATSSNLRRKTQNFEMIPKKKTNAQDAHVLWIPNLVNLLA